jgi:hypothetical protein
MVSNAFTGRTMSISTGPNNRDGCWFAVGPGAIGETGPASSSSFVRIVSSWASAQRGGAAPVQPPVQQGGFRHRPVPGLLPSNPVAQLISDGTGRARRRSRSPAPLGRDALADRHRSRTIQRSLPPANAGARSATALRAGSASLIIPSPSCAGFVVDCCRRDLERSAHNGRGRGVHPAGCFRPDKEHLASGCTRGARRAFAVFLDRDEQQRIAEPALRTSGNRHHFQSVNHY